MNPRLDLLHPYPFEKLRALKAAVTAHAELEHIALSIGEPQHAVPDFVAPILQQNSHLLGRYPTTKGSLALRETIAHWLCQRFNLNPSQVDPDRHLLPVNGTREALFAFSQTVIDSSASQQPLVVSPNPFYQIYEGAALLAGAQVVFVDAQAEHGFIPQLQQIPETVWQRCQLLHLCSPGNPTGAVMSLQDYALALELADRHNFVIASDECYSELYSDEQQPPLGLLDACRQLGREDFQRCVVFHSLSKRSNLPGLRSGFVAGDAELLAQFLLYRTYHGCSMSELTQQISQAAWSDEQHVIANRDLYRAKFAAVSSILAPHLDFNVPAAGFYLWPQTPIDDCDFAQQLFAQQNVTVLPGQYLSRPAANGINPGARRVRLALVAELDDCIAAAERIAQFCQRLS